MSAQRTYELLMQTYLLLDDGDHHVLRHFGLNPTQFAVLNLLDPQEGIRPIDLAQPLLLDKSSITRLLDRLVQEQLVSRIADPTDRRAQRITLTAAGLDRREQAKLAYQASLNQRMNSLNPEEQHQLNQLLERLLFSLMQDLHTQE